MQHRHAGTTIDNLVHKALPVAMIILLYISIYFANIDKLTGF